MRQRSFARALRALRKAWAPSRGLLLCALFLLPGLLLGGCAAKQAERSPARTPGAFLLPDGSPVADAELARRMAASDYILVGERHDSAVDHQAQAHLLRLSAEQGQRPLLGLEMLPRGRNKASLQAFSEGRLALDELPAAVDWQRAWGFDFALYRPVFEQARRHKVPVHGLNISNELRGLVSRKGIRGLSPAQRVQLPALIALPLPEQREKLTAFFQQHSAMLKGGKRPPSKDAAGSGAARSAPSRAAMPPLAPPRAPVLPVAVPGSRHGKAASVVLPLSLQGPLERFLLIQSLWDSTMAEEARNIRAEAGPGRPVIILAGGGHVEHGHGIAYRLHLLEPEARILRIMPWSPSSSFSERPEPGAADIFFHSPRPAPSGFGILFDRRGKELFIKAVIPDSRAEKAGLRAGDRIIRAGGKPLLGPADLHRAAQDARQREAPLALGVEREGKDLEVTLR